MQHLGVTFDENNLNDREDIIDEEEKVDMNANAMLSKPLATKEVFLLTPILFGVQKVAKDYNKFTLKYITGEKLHDEVWSFDASNRF